MPERRADWAALDGAPVVCDSGGNIFRYQHTSPASSVLSSCHPVFVGSIGVHSSNRGGLTCALYFDPQTNAWKKTNWGFSLGDHPRAKNTTRPDWVPSPDSDPLLPPPWTAWMRASKDDDYTLAYGFEAHVNSTLSTLPPS